MRMFNIEITTAMIIYIDVDIAELYCNFTHIATWEWCAM